MKTVLVTGATGDTGRPTVARLLKKGFRVRALVRKDDERAQRLRNSGAEIVLGDMLSLRDIRAAIAGVQRAYFLLSACGGTGRGRRDLRPSGQGTGIRANREFVT
jgi:uncharacterized protein YbjT (DUF2867 family)